jgi:signal transduction histidine kinase
MALFFIFFRTYGSLSRRHADLSSLYSFTNQVDGTLGSRDIAAVTLKEAVSILRAEHGEIILSDPTDSHASYLGFSAGEEPAQRQLPLSEVADLFTISLGDTRCRIFGPETRDSRLRIALGGDADCGIIAPISHGDGSIGVLVMAGRSGTEKRFDMAELAVLDTVANHASLTLERARVIERLSREIAEKRAVIESKDQLIASVSHELRTPLTGVLGFAEMLRTSRSDFTSEETDTMLAAISDDAVDLSNLVEDLLTAARAQTGSLRIAPSPVPLRSIISRVVESTAGTAHHVVVSGVSATVLADEGRVRQVLRNLITNAQRYGGHQIHVATYVEDTTVYLRVSDNGDGIPESAQERIFAPYESAHDAGTQPASLGLGLTISRSLARLMGGDLTYRRVDGWTTFEFKLQLARQVPPDDGDLAVEFQQV